MNARLLLPCLVAALGSTQSCTAPAAAASTAISVRYDPSELTSAAAANRLLSRIGNAALLACGASPFSLPEYKAATRRTACWQTAVADAVRRLDSPLLTRAVDRQVSHE
jgi:UrcA family protein